MMQIDPTDRMQPHRHILLQTSGTKQMDTQQHQTTFELAACHEQRRRGILQHQV